jgi:hypothetical protein
MRAVVSVATGPRYCVMQDRLNQMLDPAEYRVFWREALPPDCPTNEDVPYGFKVWAIKRAVELKAPMVLWLDSSIVPLRPLSSLWKLIEKQGYWFSENLPQGRLDLPCWNCGEWTCDSALGPLGITREEAFTIPQVIATAFGLDFRRQIARDFFDEYLRLAVERTAFQGPWYNRDGSASADPRVLGHRHDQTVASVLAWRLGMKLTLPPAWIVDGQDPTQETILSIQR